MSPVFEKAKTLRDIRRQVQLEPLPAGDPRYVNLDDVRGERLIHRFIKLLDTDDCVHLAYAGHRGSGKTTELFRLMRHLDQSDTFCAYFDAHPELATGDLEYTDVLLYIAQKVLGKAAEQVSLNEHVLRAVEEYFVEVTKITREEIRSEVAVKASATAEGGIPFLFKLLASINARIGGSSTQARELRGSFQKRPDQLIETVNLLLEHVTERLRSIGKTKVMLILDSLDRLQPDVIEKAVLQQARVFTQLKTNLILTVPLAAIYLPTGETLQSQGLKALVLPMIAVRDKAQSWAEHNPAHVARLSELIRARIAADDVFADPDLVSEMVLLSGGSFRELFELVGEAALQADELPITREHIEIAARYVWRAFKAPLRFEDRGLLAEIHRIKECDHRPDVFRLLFHRFALEYNGVGWADVHPLIMRFDERFQQLVGQPA